MSQRTSKCQVLACLLLVAIGTPTCVSRSPFTRSPAEVAVDDPCRFMGTFHKESRLRIESLRMCHVIGREEWSCMALALKGLDVDFTAHCQGESIRFREIAAEQTRRYEACLEPPRSEVIACSVLSSEPKCLAELCI